MGPPRARTEVIYVDLGYWAISGLWGIKLSVFRGFHVPQRTHLGVQGAGFGDKRFKIWD